MSDYKVTIRHNDELSFTVDNGRATIATEWNPAPGAYLATELFLAGLGACMLATLVDYAQTNGIKVDGASVEVSAESATRPMRMSAIDVRYLLPARLSAQQVDALIRAGNRCKVHHTIEHHPDIRVHATIED
jgi:uncharacterized OsmC-like protein